MTFEEAARRISEAGLRMTRPREALLRLILELRGPFSVKALHERCAPGIHLATVHRNLAEFVAVGLVDELPGDDNRLYALHRENEYGAHVYCIDCRAIMPLQCVEESDARARLSRALLEHGFDASTMRLMLAAHCTAPSDACAPRPTAPAQPVE